MPRSFVSLGVTCEEDAHVNDVMHDRVIPAFGVVPPPRLHNIFHCISEGQTLRGPIVTESQYYSISNLPRGRALTRQESQGNASHSVYDAWQR